jgi:hypothetical protein
MGATRGDVRSRRRWLRPCGGSADIAMPIFNDVLDRQRPDRPICIMSDDHDQDVQIPPGGSGGR